MEMLSFRLTDRKPPAEGERESGWHCPSLSSVHRVRLPSPITSPVTDSPSHVAAHVENRVMGAARNHGSHGAASRREASSCDAQPAGETSSGQSGALASGGLCIFGL